MRGPKTFEIDSDSQLQSTVSVFAGSIKALQTAKDIDSKIIGTQLTLYTDTGNEIVSKSVSTVYCL
jgi:hypothetical protein